MLFILKASFVVYLWFSVTRGRKDMCVVCIFVGKSVDLKIQTSKYSSTLKKLCNSDFKSCIQCCTQDLTDFIHLFLVKALFKYLKFHQLIHGVCEKRLFVRVCLEIEGMSWDIRKITGRDINSEFPDIRIVFSGPKFFFIVRQIHICITGHLNTQILDSILPGLN